MMGINVDRVKILAFVQLGVFSAFAGLFALYELSYFWPSQGSGLLLTTLAAVFVGGTSVFGGRGTIFGTFIGVMMIGSIESGIIAMGLSGFWVQFFYGLFIAAAVAIYAVLLKRRS
jgi:simple sugar transport system permease protein